MPYNLPRLRVKTTSGLSRFQLSWFSLALPKAEVQPLVKQIYT